MWKARHGIDTLASYFHRGATPRGVARVIATVLSKYLDMKADDAAGPPPMMVSSCSYSAFELACESGEGATDMLQRPRGLSAHAATKGHWHMELSEIFEHEAPNIQKIIEPTLAKMTEMNYTHANRAIELTRTLAWNPQGAPTPVFNVAGALPKHRQSVALDAHAHPLSVPVRVYGASSKASRGHAGSKQLESHGILLWALRFVCQCCVETRFSARTPPPGNLAPRRFGPRNRPPGNLVPPVSVCAAH